MVRTANKLVQVVMAGCSNKALDWILAVALVQWMDIHYLCLHIDQNSVASWPPCISFNTFATITI